MEAVKCQRVTYTPKGIGMTYSYNITNQDAKPSDDAESKSQWQKCKREVHKERWQKNKIVHKPSVSPAQCNQIVIIQKTHVGDFLCGVIIGHLECGHIQMEVYEEHGITQSNISRLWQRFQDDENTS
ncbi:hypothetical protein TNCV_2132551 [Trichonephila clavipes]|nr:hypothetical protein TNCV_2132551 [Trichonephila clavipes]